MEKPVEEKTTATQEPAKGDGKPRMKKGLKVVLCVLGGLVAFVALLLITLPLWISPVATGVAEAIVPVYTGCQFKMEKFNLNPFTGSLRIAEVHLSNPKGYQEPEAFSVSTVNVEVATCSLLTSTIHVKDITIQGPFVGISMENGTNNFMAILANLKAKLGSSEEEEEQEKDEGPSKKIIIDHFELSGTRVKMGLTIPLPGITLNGIGKASGGATFEEVGTEVKDACTKRMADFAGNAADLLKGTGDGVAEKASKASKAIGDGAKNAAESLKKLNPFGK